MGARPRPVSIGPMWDTLVDALRNQMSNQVVAGAVALGLAGVVVASLRKLPGGGCADHRIDGTVWLRKNSRAWHS